MSELEQFLLRIGLLLALIALAQFTYLKTFEKPLVPLGLQLQQVYIQDSSPCEVLVDPRRAHNTQRGRAYTRAEPLGCPPRATSARPGGL